jgi:hypothetical protein
MYSLWSRSEESMSVRMDLLGFLMRREGLYLELSRRDWSMLSKIGRFGVAKYLGLEVELMFRGRCDGVEGGWIFVPSRASSHSTLIYLGSCADDW